MNADTVQVGLVGFGLAGRVFHAPLLRAAGLQICAVVSSRPDAVSDALPDVPVVPDLEALLGMPALQVVVLATPNDLHEPQALAALQAGKCVVVDKPLAVHANAADRLLSAASSSRGSLTVFHNRRWDSDFLTVRRLMESGALGAVHTCEARWNRYRPRLVDRWREHAGSGGGLLLDLGPHLIDQALQLFGPPQWLQADVQCRREGASVEDSFEIRMACGAQRVILGADCVTADPGPRFRLHGDRASFTKHGLDVQEDQLRAGLSPLTDDFGVEPPALHGRLIQGESGKSTPVVSERGCWIEFYRAVALHVTRGAPLPVQATQAVLVLRIIEAARRSAATGRRIALG